MVDRGTKVIQKGVPELVEAVEKGKMSISAAAKLAEKPPEVQREVVKTGRPFKQNGELPQPVHRLGFRDLRLSLRVGQLIGRPRFVGS